MRLAANELILCRYQREGITVYRRTNIVRPSVTVFSRRLCVAVSFLVCACRRPRADRTFVKKTESPVYRNNQYSCLTALLTMSASESSESDEMTAEEQNQSNAENDDIHHLIGNFVHAQEESLEELVGGFMYLTMDDLKRSSNPAVMAALKKENKGERSTTSQQERSERARLNPGLAQDHLSAESATTLSKTSSLGLGGGSKTGEDDIEEETLDSSDGKQPVCEGLLRNRPASLTKFDNFITSEDVVADETGEPSENDEGKSDDEWLNTPGYTASFGTDHVEKSIRRDTTLAEDLFTRQPNTGLPTLPSLSPQQNAEVSSENQANVAQPPDNLEDILHRECSSQDLSSMTPELKGRLLNPGEAEEEEVCRSLVTQTVSILDFSTRPAVVSSGSATPPPVSSEECSDEVVPFALDENFDYDSVAYTPKYTAAEMEYLTSFLPQKS